MIGQPANPFDQFDAPAAPNPAAAPEGNPFDQFDAPAANPDPGAAHRGPAMDAYYAGSQVLDAFGQGFRHGWGSQPLGLSPLSEDALKKLGIFADQQTGDGNLVREFNEAVIRPAARAIFPAATAMDLVQRAYSGVQYGLGAAAAAPPAAWYDPLRAAQLAAGPAAEAMQLFPLGGAELGLGPAMPPRSGPGWAPDLGVAHELGIVGGDEGSWLGALKPAPEEADRAAIAALEPRNPSAGQRVAGPYGPPASAAPPDIHQVARAIMPDKFADWDALQAQQTALGEQLDQLAGARAQLPEAQAAQQQIDTIIGRVNGVEARLTNAARARLEDARDALHEILTSDTEDMARLRQQRLQADYQLRDLAPEVSAAYRQAAEQMPPFATTERPIAAEPPAAAAGEPNPAAATGVAVPAEPTPPAASAAPAEPAGTIARPEPAVPSAALTPPGNLAAIAAHVSRQLVQAGRPQDEADAAAAIVAPHYEARAQRFQGGLGTPYEIYQRDGATIRGAAAGGPRGAAAGRSTLRQIGRQAKTTITLFGQADASTFLHETGHQWLGELLRDAERPEAPADLKSDAATVRAWLGRASGEPSRAQHEQFARGFEAYVMEGRAPSAGLAQVFGQFRQWLVQLYNPVAAQKLPVIDSVRGVYDRLLAMPERITLAADNAIAAERSPAREAALAATPAAPYPPAELAALQERETAAEQRLRAPTVRGRPETAYAAVPPEPLRLAEFLRQQGGVRDQGGELRQIDARRRPGLVNRAGLSLDAAREAAEEAGYLPPNSDINALLAALDEDLRGVPQYSAVDEAAAGAYREAVNSNREIDRLAQQLGIDPHDWTKEQFWNLAAEHLSAEQNAAMQGEIDTAHQAEYDDAERQAREWAESRGDAWEPQRHRGRTLEDMLDEDAAERLAGAASARAGRAERAGIAAADPGALQERGGQGGGAAGTAGGDGAPGAGAPAAARRFGAGSRLVERAGNIRLDNLEQPDDVLPAIREAAARNGAFLPARRGRLSDGEVLDLALALGRDPAFLDAKKLGEAFNAEEVLAARHLLIGSARRVRDLMQQVAEGGDPLELARAMARHEMIQGKVAQATAEWGRAGRSFRRLMAGQPAADQLAAFLAEHSGRTLYQIQEMARLGQHLKTPGEVSKFVSDTKAGRIRRAIVFYWINALISGPVTHLRYSVGNALNALWTPLVEIPLAAGIGAARERLGMVQSGDRVYLGEAWKQLYALGKGTRDGWGAAVDAWHDGQSPALPGERARVSPFDSEAAPPIPGRLGQAIGVPSRAVGAIHAFFKSLRYEQNIQSLAYRQATVEHLTGQDFANRIAELTSSPSADMMQQATASALRELYMAPTEYHSVMGALVRASNHPSNGGLALKIIAPFMKIGSQVTRNAFLERTPLGLADRQIRGAVLSNGAASDLQLAKMTAGIGLAATAVLATLEGHVTGDGPSDPNRRAVWLLSHRPNTLRIGDVTIPYQGLGNLGMLFRFAANMTETAQGWDEQDGGKLAVDVLEGISRSILDENFMRGVKDALDAVYHPQEYGPGYLRNFAANWLPYSVGLGQVARLVDPAERQAKTVWQAVENRIPLLSEQLQPRRDRFGEPIPNITGLPQGLGPAARYAADPVTQAMERLQLGVAPLEKRVRGVALDDQQYDEFSRLAGRLAKARLDLVIGLPGFGQLPAEAQIDLIHRTISASRENARAALLLHYPQLIAQAIAAKTAGLRGKTP